MFYDILWPAVIALVMLLGYIANRRLTAQGREHSRQLNRRR